MGLQLHSQQKREEAHQNILNRGDSMIITSNNLLEADVNRLLLDMVIACDHNVSVLNNLATYELLERGVVLSPEDVRIYDFIRDLVNYNQDKAVAREKYLILSETADDLRTICVSADAYCLQQVLQNILDIVFNVTPANKTIHFTLSRLAHDHCGAHGQPLTSPTILGTHTLKPIQNLTSLQTQFPVLERLLSRSRTLPDCNQLRVTVSILDFIPPKVTSCPLALQATDFACSFTFQIKMYNAY